MSGNFLKDLPRGNALSAVFGKKGKEGMEKERGKEGKRKEKGK